MNTQEDCRSRGVVRGQSHRLRTASIVKTEQSAIWKQHHREPAVPGNSLPAAGCCEMKRGVLRSGRRVNIVGDCLWSLRKWLLTYLPTSIQSLLSPLLTLHWKQSLVLEPGWWWEWGGVGEWGGRWGEEGVQLLWLGKLGKVCQRKQHARQSLNASRRQCKGQSVREQVRARAEPSSQHPAKLRKKNSGLAHMWNGSVKRGS